MCSKALLAARLEAVQGRAPQVVDFQCLVDIPILALLIFLVEMVSVVSPE
jgi:hypothetical protein